MKLRAKQNVKTPGGRIFLAGEIYEMRAAEYLALMFGPDGDSFSSIDDHEVTHEIQGNKEFEADQRSVLAKG